MPTYVDFNGIRYDLNSQTEAAAYMAALAEALTLQQNTIRDLRTQAGGMNAEQMAQLIAAINPAPTPRDQRVVNPVLSTNGTQVYLEQHPVPAGIKDVKSFPHPDSFKGTKTDAEPFISRLKAYFMAKPEAMKFTQSRILYATEHLKNPLTNPWASLVRKAISEGLNNAYYYDNWDNFQTEFLKRYGLTDRPQHYFIRMTQYHQFPSQDCKSFTDEFERLRVESNTTKENAFYYLKKGTLSTLRSHLNFRTDSPDNYDDWIKALVQFQSKLDQERSFNQMGQQRRTTQYHGNQGGRSYTQNPSQSRPLPPGDPMDIDALAHQRRQQQKGKVPDSRKKPFQKNIPPSKPSNRLAPHPNAPSSSKKPFTGAPRPQNRSPFFCFICNGQGHYARDCKASINELSLQHIQQMAMAMEASMDAREVLDEDELGDGSLIDIFEQLDTEEAEESLIDFEDDPSPQAEDDNQGQDF